MNAVRYLTALGWVSLLSLLATGCQRQGQESTERAPAPIQAATVIAGCSGLDACLHACDSGAGAACVEAGRLYEFGHGIAVDKAHAYKLYEQSCALGYAGGCYNGAVLLETGSGVAKNPTRAAALYRRVCQMGAKTACERAAALGG